MEGMRFLLLNEKGEPVNHGIITKTITAERYLCHFARDPVMSRVARLEEIETWQLFASDDDLNKFISSIAKANKPPAAASKPPAPKPAKKAKKKKASKEPVWQGER